MAAPQLQPGLNDILIPESVASNFLGIKRANTVVGVANCEATWLESKLDMTPLSIECSLNFVGAGGCENYNCTKVDYLTTPDLDVKRLKDFNPNSINCTSNTSTTTNLELKRNIKYLTEKCVLNVANAVLTLNNNNMQPVAIAFNLNITPTNAYNNIVPLPSINSLKQKLTVKCCGVDSFTANSSKYVSTMPVFSSFSSRLI